MRCAHNQIAKRKEANDQLEADRLKRLREATEQANIKANYILLKTRPDIVGIEWWGGGSMRFYSSGKCDIVPDYKKLDGKTVAGIVDGSWTLENLSTGSFDWVIRVTSTFEGTQRVDKWKLLPSSKKLGQIMLMGAPVQKPYSQILFGNLPVN